LPLPQLFSPKTHARLSDQNCSTDMVFSGDPPFRGDYSFASVGSEDNISVTQAGSTSGRQQEFSEEVPGIPPSVPPLASYRAKSAKGHGQQRGGGHLRTMWLLLSTTNKQQSIDSPVTTGR